MESTHKIKQMHGVLDAENVSSLCFGHLSDLIKNGRVRKNFVLFSESSRNNQRLLKDRFVNPEIETFMNRQACEYCRLRPESFSLSGALNLGVELTQIAIKFYKDLESAADKEENRRLFKSIIAEKKRQLDFLKKEKKFMRREEDKSDFIDSHCIDEVISKLWT